MVQRPDILTLKMYNKIEGSSSLSNKKSLFFNLMEYYQRIGVDPYLTLPLTFHIKDGLNSPSFNEFKQEYEQNLSEGSNVWIVKPGENANRGFGIQVAKTFREIQQIITRGTDKTQKDYDPYL